MDRLSAGDKVINARGRRHSFSLSQHSDLAHHGGDLPRGPQHDATNCYRTRQRVPASLPGVSLNNLGLRSAPRSALRLMGSHSPNWPRSLGERPETFLSSPARNGLEGVPWWRIWWQMWGRRGTSGEAGPRKISNLLIHLPFLPFDSRRLHQFFLLPSGT